jgi:hypothetical protein
VISGLLGPSVDLADLAGDPDGRPLCRRYLGVAIHPVNDLQWFAFVILPVAVVALGGL